MQQDEIRTIIRDHIAEQFLSGEDPSDLTDDVLLITDGILDSLASLRLVSFLEERFGVRIEAHEVDVDHLDKLSSIAALVAAKSK